MAIPHSEWSLSLTLDISDELLHSVMSAVHIFRVNLSKSYKCELKRMHHLRKGKGY